MIPDGRGDGDCRRNSHYEERIGPCPARSGKPICQIEENAREKACLRQAYQSSNAVKAPHAERMSVFLGHPVYALSVVLFSLILWTGFGSMASEHKRLDGAGKLWPGAWRVPLTYLRCRSGCRSCSASMERTSSFAPAFASLWWRRQVS